MLTAAPLRGVRAYPRLSATVLLLLSSSAFVAAPGAGARGAAAQSRIIPAPAAVLGFVPGEERRLADWKQVLEYLVLLDAASDRIQVEEVGKTTQGRPFVVVTVSSAANLARLEEIRLDNARLWDPRGLADAEAERIVQRGKAIVAMGFSIHSTEVGGTLSSLRLLYELAAAQDEETSAILDATVLVVVPSQNPDGTNLVASWYRQQLGTPFEGSSPPVLYHPYTGHDNNRDWYMFTQQETRLLLQAVYRRWHPQVFHDVHQMRPRGARLFLPPYHDPWEPNVDPALVAAVNALGAHVASRLTSAGHAGIVSGMLFDAWTPSRAYSHTHGGVRILSETASARLATTLELKPGELEPRTDGLARDAPSATQPWPWRGERWRLADIVDTQTAVSLAVLDHAARNREHWLRTFFAVNRRSSARRQPLAFVVPKDEGEPAAVARLIEVLRQGEVEVRRAGAAFEAAGRRFEAGSHVVMMQQPASGFAKSLLERQRYPELRDASGRPRPPYDATAHTLPLLLGVPVVALSEPFEALLEPPLTSSSPAPGRVEPGGARLALGHATADLLAISRLLAEGVSVRWAQDAFQDAGRRFSPGTLLVPASARPHLEPLARELGLVARAIHAEPRSLGLKRPRVGLYRSWSPAMDEGWTRFVFENETGIPYQTLHDREVRIGGLRERFDAIVLPDQAPRALAEGHADGTMPPEYTGGLGPRGAASLKAFVEAGGTLVALDSASSWAIEALQLPVRDALAGLGSETFYCPGSILELETDPAQPLAHGLPARLPIWFEGSPAFELSAGQAVASHPPEAGTLLSGWLVGKERLAGKVALAEVPLGRGRVVLFGFRPQYRAQSRVTYPALLNALYLSAAER